MYITAEYTKRTFWCVQWKEAILRLCKVVDVPSTVPHCPLSPRTWNDMFIHNQKRWKMILERCSRGQTSHNFLRRATDFYVVTSWCAAGTKGLFHVGLEQIKPLFSDPKGVYFCQVQVEICFMYLYVSTVCPKILFLSNEPFFYGSK